MQDPKKIDNNTRNTSIVDIVEIKIIALSILNYQHVNIKLTICI